MIEVLQEITDWGDEKVSNHTYIVKNKSSLVGYIPKGAKEIIEFKKPLSFSKSRRKFIVKKYHCLSRKSIEHGGFKIWGKNI